MVYSFKVEGKVKPKQSTKFARVGNFVKTYTPKDVKQNALWIKTCFKMSYPDFEPLEGAVYVTVRAYFAIPKSFTKKKRELIKNGQLFPTKKPDCDNIAKNLNDALNGLAWKDDSQIVCLEVFKHYAETDYMEIEFDSYDEPPF